MDAAEIQGLDPSLYKTPHLAAVYLDDAALIATAEVEFSCAVSRFVTHLSTGRIRPAQVSALITFEPERPDVGKLLTELSTTTDVGLALSRFEPTNPQYQALKAKLAELRSSEAAEEQAPVPEGPALKPGNKDARAPILRVRLAAVLDEGADAEIYDPVLVDAVKAFQKASGLSADGIVGPRTIALLNGPTREDDVTAVIANMERWRWMPRDLGAFHVIVNVPEFVVRVVDNDAVVHETRVVVGKPTNPTPTFSNVMSYLIVNPFWNVPTSIVSKEMLPDIRQDPYGFFAKHGYQVLARAGGRMRVVDPGSIDWGSINPHSVAVRQVPGDANALGRIKFMFPNQYSVYLHDTPSKSLFKKDFRAYSHGCVRVDNPLDFADAILAVAAPEWNSKRLQRLYGGPERRINLDNPIPVHLSYFTLTVDPTGTVHRFADVYGYDRKMKAFLGT
jgi:murein L,D-transpeptidase YcbB/YkuD